MPPTIQDVLDRIDVLEAKLIGNGTKHDYFEDDEGTIGRQFYQTTWYSQIYTAVVNYPLSYINLKLCRYGLPGIVTVSIRNVNENGKPTGSDLCSGSIDGATLTTNQNGEWYSILLNPAINIQEANKYAIIVRATAGDASNTIFWRFNQNGGYSEGTAVVSYDSGNSWVIYSNWDMAFATFAIPSLSDVLGSTIKIIEKINANLPEARTG